MLDPSRTSVSSDESSTQHENSHYHHHPKPSQSNSSSVLRHNQSSSSEATALIRPSSFISFGSGGGGVGKTSSVCSLEDDMLDYSDDELDSDISMDTMDFDFGVGGGSSTGDHKNGKEIGEDGVIRKSGSSGCSSAKRDKERNKNGDGSMSGDDGDEGQEDADKVRKKSVNIV